jgi:hypothetical protein
MTFQNIDIKDFSVDTVSEEDCLKFIAEKKWGTEFCCKKCGHTNYCKGKTPYSRRCTRCKHDESATANTIFHRCHIPLKEAFQIVYLVCNDPTVSSYELSRQIELRQMTCWKLKARLMDCIKNRGEIDILYSENRSNFTQRK